MHLEVAEVGRHGRWGALAWIAIHGSVGGGGSSRGRGHLVELGTVVDESVVVRLGQPFVDDGSAPRAGHVRPENGRLVREITRWMTVTTGLGQEDGNGVGRCVLLKLIVAGRGICAIATPLVGIETKEI